MGAEIRVGISGWKYKGWRGKFYPEGLAQRLELEYASRLFSSIELNGSFYSLQTPKSFRAWRDETPPGFVFAVKGSRFITHMKKLNAIEEPLARFFDSGVFELGAKLGPILWQFPANLGFRRERFARFLELLPRSGPQQPRLRYAFEIRHESFLCEEFYSLLRRHDAALVIADTAGKFPYAEVATASFTYVRLHGESQLYVSGYDDASLGRWASKIRSCSRSGDVYVYFDNDAKAHAPFDALALAAKLGLARLSAAA